MEAVGGTASIIAVVEISAQIVTACLKYSQAVKKAPEDIESLRKEVENSQTVFQAVQAALEENLNHDPLSTAQLGRINEHHDQLRKVLEKLETGKSQKFKERLGMRLKWPFDRKDLDHVLENLSKSKQDLQLILSSIQMKSTSEINRKLDLLKLHTVDEARFDMYKEDQKSRCLNGTRVDLLDEIMTWAADNLSAIVFLLIGMMGTGKSTIARSVCHKLKDKQTLGASFFFKRGEGDRGSARKLFPTLAYQFSVSNSSYRRKVLENLQDDTWSPQNSPLSIQYKRLLAEPLSELSDSTLLVIVIDALDECDSTQDVKTILYLFQELAVKGEFKIKIFITSRPEEPIQLSIRQIPGGVREYFILHDVPEAIVRHDIELYLRHELGRIREMYAMEPAQNWPASDDFKLLLDMAVPLFIIASTIITFLDDARHSPLKRLEAVISTQIDTPGHTTSNHGYQLAQIYLPILQQLFSESDDSYWRERTIELFRRIVGSIILFAEPLSKLSIAKLLKIPQNDIDILLVQLQSVIYLPKGLHQQVRILHLSFHDYLINESMHTNDLFWIDLKATHKLIALDCLERLQDAGNLRQDLCDLRDPAFHSKTIPKSLIDRNVSQDLQYACRYWMHHVSSGEVKLEDDGIVHQFLRKFYLYWLEFMCLKHFSVYAITMLQQLETLLANNCSSLTKFVKDARHFLREYSCILEDYPLQIYSALVFRPVNCAVKQAFRHCIPAYDREFMDEITTLKYVGQNRLLTVNREDIAKVWDDQTGVHLDILEGDIKLIGEAIDTCAISSDGKLASLNLHKNFITFWDIHTNARLKVLELPKLMTEQLDRVRDYETIKQSHLWFINSEKLGFCCDIWMLRTLLPVNLTLGATLVTIAWLCDVKTGEFFLDGTQGYLNIDIKLGIHELEYQEPFLYHRFLCSSLSRFFLWNHVYDDGKWHVELRDAQSESLIQLLTNTEKLYPSDFQQVEVSANFKFAAAAYTGAIFLWNLTTSEFILRIPMLNNRPRVTFSSDCSRLVISSIYNTILFHDLKALINARQTEPQNHNDEKSFPSRSEIFRLSESGAHVAHVLYTGKIMIQDLNLDNARLLRTVNEVVLILEFSQDEKWLAYMTGSGHVTLISIDEPERSFLLNAYSGIMASYTDPKIHFSLDDEWLVYTCYNEMSAFNITCIREEKTASQKRLIGSKLTIRSTLATRPSYAVFNGHIAIRKGTEIELRSLSDTRTILSTIRNVVEREFPPLTMAISEDKQVIALLKPHRGILEQCTIEYFDIPTGEKCNGRLWSTFNKDSKIFGEDGSYLVHRCSRSISEEEEIDESFLDYVPIKTRLRGSIYRRVGDMHWISRGKRRVLWIPQRFRTPTIWNFRKTTAVFWFEESWYTLKFDVHKLPWNVDPDNFEEDPSYSDVESDW